MNESGDPDTFNSCGPHDSSLIMAFPSKKKRKKKSRSFDEKNSSDILIIKKEIIERSLLQLAEDCSVKLFNFYDSLDK